MPKGRQTIAYEGVHDILVFGLRCAGLGLIALAIMHIPIGRRLKWKEERSRMTAVNGAIFHVHMVFICTVEVTVGLPCLLDPTIFLEQTRAGLWASCLMAAFWGFRLWTQFMIYPVSLWKGKAIETRVHWLLTGVWVGLTVLFGLCALSQLGWIG